ncbi:unnamed protein product [Orchesella dallaii]|uniref:TNF receptor-associated factor 6 n=1 Tax=Orchesella dallaii TaxID=48710 RepID=A0ABP1R4L8_9HEXA
MASCSPNTNITSSTSAEDVSSNATLTTNVASSTNTATWPANATEGGGYDYELVDGTDSRYECPICLLCLRDPVLTTCGHRFCSSCINQWVTGENGKCPVDSVSLSHENIFPDNFTRREVMQCNAKCPMTGCTTVHKIVDMEKHIETTHMGGAATNGGGALLECPYKEVGCVVPLRQDQFERHLKNDVHHHLQLLTAAYRRLKIYSSRSNLEYSTGGSLEFFMRQDSQDSTRFLLDESLSPDDYQFRRQRSWDSVRFARKHNIRPSNLNSTWLPESDESLCHASPLPPPIPSTSTANALATTCQSQSSPKDLKSCKTNGTGNGGGMDQQHHLQDIFQRLVLLEQKDREKQIKIDKVEAEHASVVNLFGTSAQVIKDFNARYCHGVYVWRIPEFRKLCLAMRRNPNQVLNSPGFYTDTFGYKLCLRFNLKSPSSSSSSSLPVAGATSGYHSNDIPLEHDEHTFISFYVHFMQGEFDDTLHWPFHGNIRVHMIHPTVPEDTIKEKMESSPTIGAFAKPTLPRNPKGWGYNEFCPLNKVFTNGFVKNDTLLCKVIARSYVD